jgi:hypothetical protein
MGQQRTADIESRFVAYVDGLAGVIGHGDRERPLRDYCTGLVMPCERKSVEPMAAVTAPARVGAQHQSLLHFVGEAPWSDENVLAKAAQLQSRETCAGKFLDAVRLDEGISERGHSSPSFVYRAGTAGVCFVFVCTAAGSVYCALGSESIPPSMGQNLLGREWLP